MYLLQRSIFVHIARSCTGDMRGMGTGCMGRAWSRERTLRAQGSLCGGVSPFSVVLHRVNKYQGTALMGYARSLRSSRGCSLPLFGGVSGRMLDSHPVFVRGHSCSLKARGLGTDGSGDDESSRNTSFNSSYTDNGNNKDDTSNRNNSTSNCKVNSSSDKINGSDSSQKDNESDRRIKSKKRRLDDICRELYPEHSRNVIQSFITQGKVLVAGKAITKSGHQVHPTAKIELIAEIPKYVCRAGQKMEAALEAFDVTVEGRVALDAGLSTGGFTDCLLQNGVSHVFGVDVGYGQVAEKIRVHPQVTVLERTNLRHMRKADLQAISDKKVDLVTLDVSFISTLKMIGAVTDIMQPCGDVIILIKPQFEAGKQHVAAGGVVKDPAVRLSVLRDIIIGWERAGFRCLKLIESPITGASSGNVEYLGHFVKICTTVHNDLGVHGDHAEGLVDQNFHVHDHEQHNHIEELIQSITRN